MTHARASAFVPGHVTVFFSPLFHEDADRAGSTGAGITLADGVSVTVEIAPEVRIELNGERVEVEPVERTLGELSVTASVSAETPLPVGAGFGVSGAMALGTALAGNQVSAETRSENELVAIAHRAEVQAGTGLGDVVAQARGGLPIRLSPGAPGHGQLDGIPAPVSLEYLSFGELDTPEVLASDTESINTAGEEALQRLRERPTVATLFDAGYRFARESGLLTPRVEEVVAEVRATGGTATMAMLGETVIARGTGLTEAGYDPSACLSHPTGARICSGADSDRIG